MPTQDVLFFIFMSSAKFCYLILRYLKLCDYMLVLIDYNVKKVLLQIYS